MFRRLPLYRPLTCCHVCSWCRPVLADHQRRWCLWQLKDCRSPSYWEHHRCWPPPRWRAPSGVHLQAAWSPGCSQSSGLDEPISIVRIICLKPIFKFRSFLLAMGFTKFKQFDYFTWQIFCIFCFDHVVVCLCLCCQAALTQPRWNRLAEFSLSHS